MCVHNLCTYISTVYVRFSLLQLLDKMESSLFPLISAIFEKGILGKNGEGMEACVVQPVMALQMCNSYVSYWEDVQSMVASV